MPSLHLSRTHKWLLTSPPAEWAISQLRSLLINTLRCGPIPEHIAFVMDGNRRFARAHQIETVEGHNLGFEALARILEVCYKSGVRVVTIYAFSIENFKRSKYEVDALMEMAKLKLGQLAQHGELLQRYGASVRVLGRRELVREDVLVEIDRAVELTSGNKRTILNICFPYTSRDEITTAVQRTVSEYSQPIPPLSTRAQQQQQQQQTSNDTSSPSPTSRSPSPSTRSSSSSSTLTLLAPTPTYPDVETITATTLSSHLFTAGCPPLALLIRTSGVQRLSDFMLWQCHQDTEIVFLDCLWPEFDLWHFLPVLLEWQWRQKRMAEVDVAKAAATAAASGQGKGLQGERGRVRDRGREKVL
ncbi:MAG: cis-prenyltransferase [Trizodia sp. TS-e1964]|nr:MAG: cis-prenyltransferase [Trizodia sp. TS-e1964]